MASTDGGLRPLFRERLKSRSHWQSVETGLVGPGTPDSHFCLQRHDGVAVEGWIEFKQASDWAPQIKIEQVGWHLARAALGARTLVAVRRKHEGGPRKGPAVDELWICEGRYLGILNTERMRSPRISWSGFWEGGPSKWDWEAIRRCLTNE